PGRSISDHTLRIGRGARIRSFTVIYAGANIGSHLETGHHVVIREETLIGDNVSIWSHSYIDYGCRIGDDVRIHQGVYLAQNSVVEDGAFLAPHVAVANDRYPACPRCLHGPRIRRGARVGVGVILLPGVEVGE